MNRLIQGPDPRVWGSRDDNIPRDPGFRAVRSEISGWLESESLPPRFRHPLASLLREKNLEIFWSDLAGLAQEATQGGHLPIAWELNRVLEEYVPDPELRHRATWNQKILGGRYPSFAENLEFRSGHFLAESTQAANLLAMVGAGLAYRLGRRIGLAWAAEIGELSFGASWTRSAMPPLLGFSMEVPTFVCGRKLIAQTWGQKVSWEDWPDEMRQTALMFGLMKWGGRAGVGMKFWFGKRGWEGSLLGALWVQGGLLAGLEVGALLGVEGDRSFFDNLVLLLQFSAAQGLLGPFVQAPGPDPVGLGFDIAKLAKPSLAWGSSGLRGSFQTAQLRPFEGRSYMVSHDGKGARGGSSQQVWKPTASLEGLVVELAPGRKALLQEVPSSSMGAELWTLAEIRYQKIILIPAEELGQAGARRLEISHKHWRDFGSQQGKQFVAIPYLEPKLTALLARPPQELLQRLEQNRMTYRELKSLLEDPLLNRSREHRTSFYQWNPRPWFDRWRGDPQAVSLIHQLHGLEHPLAPDLLARTDFSYFSSQQVQQNALLLKTLGRTQKILPENTSARELWRELPEALRELYEGSHLEPK